MKIYLLIFLFLTACGKFEEKFGRLNSNETAVKVSWNAQESPLALLPGIMIYAVRANDVLSRGSRFVANESTQADWLVPNGTYNFYAIGYSGSNMTGTMYCGRSSANVNLGGGAITIPINIASAGECGTPPFSPSGYSNGANFPKSLSFGLCNTSGSIQETSDVVSCDGTGSPQRPGAGAAAYYSISLPEYNGFNSAVMPAGLSGSLSTGCLSGPIAGSASTTGISVPHGLPFALEISTYSLVGCTGFIGSYILTRGTDQASNNSTLLLKNSSGPVTPAIQAVNIGVGTGVIKVYARQF